ncbi:MAG TPA: FoF1 ATP synthase subunit gamma [Geomonas sp.]
MGKRTDIDRRLRTLTDISAILRVMRTLAIMETGKLSRFLAAQTRVVESIEAAAADFLYFYPEVVTPAENVVAVRLMIGSERGFCGDFNEVVLRTKAKLQSDPASPAPVLMAVGSRLCGKILREALDIPLTGACTVEEVQSVISRVIEELNGLAVKGALRLTVLCHGQEDGAVITRTLQPFPSDLTPISRHSHAPILNLPPAPFYSELAGHYLFAALHEMFYQSLMAENQQRQRHIDNAARRMDQKIAGLNQKKNAVRQEEIIEEIEILMLSAEHDFQNDSSAAPLNMQGCGKSMPDRTAHSRQENI